LRPLTSLYIEATLPFEEFPIRRFMCPLLIFAFTKTNLLAPKCSMAFLSGVMCSIRTTRGSKRNPRKSAPGNTAETLPSIAAHIAAWRIHPLCNAGPQSAVRGGAAHCRLVDRAFGSLRNRRDQQTHPVLSRQARRKLERECPSGALGRP